MKVEGVVNSKVYLIRHNFKREIIINKKYQITCKYRKNHGG